MVHLLNLKSEANISNGFFDYCLMAVKGLLHKNEKLEANYYETKKMLKFLVCPIKS